MKFTNPLRVYSHLLSGRLIEQTLKLESTIHDYENGLIPKEEKKKSKKKKKAQ